MKKQIVFKVVVVGDGAVGKTTLLHRFVEREFIDTATMTVGVEFLHREIQVEGYTCQLQLWDIGGQERFRFMVDQYMPGTKGALLLFDTTSMKSFVNISKWVQLIRDNGADVPIILVGTKCDLEEFAMVKNYYAELTAKKQKMIDYVKTSAKTGLNVDEVFKILVSHLIKINIG